ncbi:MAG: hypothetical protein FWB86_07970 [Treponema sp.]|nr:hypothetical protein [Treponema sp.]MCL2252167.1 hypothetical protein [Treponema sp.]
MAIFNESKDNIPIDSLSIILKKVENLHQPKDIIDFYKGLSKKYQKRINIVKACLERFSNHLPPGNKDELICFFKILPKTIQNNKGIVCMFIKKIFSRYTVTIKEVVPDIFLNDIDIIKLIIIKIHSNQTVIFYKMLPLNMQENIEIIMFCLKKFYNYFGNNSKYFYSEGIISFYNIIPKKTKDNIEIISHIVNIIESKYIISFFKELSNISQSKKEIVQLFIEKDKDNIDIFKVLPEKIKKDKNIIKQRKMIMKKLNDDIKNMIEMSLKKISDMPLEEKIKIITDEVEREGYWYDASELGYGAWPCYEEPVYKTKEELVKNRPERVRSYLFNYRYLIPKKNRLILCNRLKKEVNNIYMELITAYPDFIDKYISK